jgi:hypothetical protein
MGGAKPALINVFFPCVRKMVVVAGYVHPKTRYANFRERYPPHKI